jgi:hypothetical protein
MESAAGAVLGDAGTLVSEGAAGGESGVPARAIGRMPMLLFVRFTTPVIRLRCGS